MDTKKIKTLLKDKLSLNEIYITGNNNHLHIIAIGEIFQGMNEVKRQQSIYTYLTKDILEKKIHAISIQSYSPKEWSTKKILYNI
ncbi:BolA/IbaG family iron-sulfur metabolism protein [Buchnera aphidicola (Formosaphis micheliae)]|uniref:BolA family protein n=1 Tax=Buchnera aphidicola TaxID=9 RepID=UPI0031B7FAFE